MARTKRRGKVARKSRVQTRRNNAMKPRVQTRRNNAVKKSVRSKRPRRSRGKMKGGEIGVLNTKTQFEDLPLNEKLAFANFAQRFLGPTADVAYATDKYPKLTGGLIERTGSDSYDDKNNTFVLTFSNSGNFPESGSTSGQTGVDMGRFRVIENSVDKKRTLQMLVQSYNGDDEKQQYDFIVSQK